MAKDFPDGYHNRPHKHERAQLIFAAHGAMLVATSAGSWAVPPQRAVWMPAGLVLYWLSSNVMAIGQQYVTNRIIGAPAPARVPAKPAVRGNNAAKKS